MSPAPASAPTAVGLSTRGATFSYHPRAPVLRGIDLDVPKGAFLGIVGPNGAGKSTLLGLLSGVLSPNTGSATLDGRPLSEWKRRDVARRIAVVPQSEPMAFPYRVSEIVLMGRTPHLHGWLATETDEDRAAAARALDAVGIADLLCRPMNELSGGERQMVLAARALAQEPGILLLDEPTASLDLAHQQSLFRLLTKRNAEHGLTVVVVTHDLNLAALYCRSLAVLHEGRIAALGAPSDILKPDFLGSVYGAGLWSATSPTGAPIVGLTR